MKLVSLPRILLLAACLGVHSGSLQGALPAKLAGLIQQNCGQCHDRETAAGGLDLAALPFELSDRSRRDHWIRIHDRIEKGEMPPKSGTLPTAQRAQMVNLLARAIHDVDHREVLAQGRGGMRRLNREEYEQNLRDALQLPTTIGCAICCWPWCKAGSSSARPEAAKTMNIPHLFTAAARIPRRTFLRGIGVTLGLPMLECMLPRLSRATPPPAPQRMLLISNNLGILPKPFFPTRAGRDYELSPLLAGLAEFRNDFTVCSGLAHPDVVGGHSTENCFLTAARGPTRSGFRNQVSLDQFAADKLGPLTRFATLNLGVNIDKANRSLSWTRDGILLPAEDSAPALFRKMFVQGDPATVARQVRRLDERGSILDALRADSRQFSRRLGPADRTRLDQYFTSIRDLEERLQTTREWALRAKPATAQPLPPEVQDPKLFFQKFALMLSMAQLAFESDATRIVTLMVDAFATPVFKLHENQNTTDDYHNLSHHGQASEKVRQLEDADRQQMALLRQLMTELARKADGDQRLLDRTMILYGSNMGDASTHDNSNLPILLAGGGFKHGQHLAFRRDDNKPLSNLFVTLLQRMGVEAGSFGSSTGTLTGLEQA